jgi:type II secretory pathway pseudopilin PulG
LEASGDFPEASKSSPDASGHRPDSSKCLPETSKCSPEVSKTVPEASKCLPETGKSGFFPCFSQKTVKFAQNTGSSRRRSPAALRHLVGFSLVEVLLVITLLSLIVLALMAVFDSTQRAFRASVTQTDVLEGGRMTMDLMATDMRSLSPSGGLSNGPVNFSVLPNYTFYTPLVQTLPGSTVQRTNLLNYFFILGRQNTKWTATAYIVNTATNNPLFGLYRFYAETNTATSPSVLFSLFINQIQQPNSFSSSANFSHLIDGVVHLTVRPYDKNGTWINGYWTGNAYSYTNAANTEFFSSPPSWAETAFYMFSNTVPAAVDIELGVLENQALARAASLGIPGQAPNNVTAQWNYLAGQSGTVHLFRQRVSIPNVAPSVYQ